MRGTASLISLVSSIAIFAQTGINTPSPAATLDVQAKNANASQSLEGVIAPRLLGSQLSAKSYTTAQTGAIVYITDTSATLTGQTINVNGDGYYYFDGTVWRRIGTPAISNNSWQIAYVDINSLVLAPEPLTVQSPNPGQQISGTTLTVVVPPGYSQNKVVLNWALWGDLGADAPANGSLRFSIRQGGTTSNTIPSIMMTGWAIIGGFTRWTAPIIYTVENLAPGTYTFNLLIQRESEYLTGAFGGINCWGREGKAEVYVK